MQLYLVLFNQRSENLELLHIVQCKQFDDDLDAVDYAEYLKSLGNYFNIRIITYVKGDVRYI